jgi:hypothetical protein
MKHTVWREKRPCEMQRFMAALQECLFHNTQNLFWVSIDLSAAAWPFHNTGYTTYRKPFTDSTTTHSTLHLDLVPAKSSSRHQNLFSYRPVQYHPLFSFTGSQTVALQKISPPESILRNNQNYCTKIHTSLNTTTCSQFSIHLHFNKYTHTPIWYLYLTEKNSGYIFRCTVSQGYQIGYLEKLSCIL